jgi:trimeric autotransporter adhesin
LGDGAGLEVTTGSNNIDIGNSGGSGESNTIRIGNSQDIAAYITGIDGQTVGAGGTVCYIDNDGKLGVFLSARRYKENIQPMKNTSAALFSLKPVTFRYKHQFDGSGTPQFGLIAEEVAAVNPDLVVHDSKGEVSTVRYEAINVMLLNEFLKEHQKVEQLEATVADLATQLWQVSAQLQLNSSSSPHGIAANQP